MIVQSTFNFLNALKENNNRDWFAENKKQFDVEYKQIKAVFTKIGEELGKLDSIETIKTYRIYRDIRFSKNKTPYKTNFCVGYTRTKPLLRGGYYLQIEPGNNSFVGGGFWEPNAADLLRIRKELALDASELRKIIISEEFQKYFGALQGEELKTAPKGFDKSHPDIDLIRKKQFLVTRKFTDNEVLSPNFEKEVLHAFSAMRPFFDYMSAVLGTDLNGESIY